MTVTITPNHVTQLIAIESSVHYTETPPPGRNPFVVIPRKSPVLLSAPHGAITYRNNVDQVWHEEDEYTAGMVLLLGELCQTSVIATTWRSEVEDPNYHGEARSAYKQAIRQLVQEKGIRWVIDLHGASDSSLEPGQLVDLGTRKEKQSLPVERLRKLTHLVEKRLGQGTVSYNHFAAEFPGTITAYSQGKIHIHSVQVEMKPAVRVPLRRTDASTFAESGPFAAQPEHVIGMLQALADFIASLESETK